MELRVVRYRNAVVGTAQQQRLHPPPCVIAQDLPSHRAKPVNELAR